MVRTVLSVDVGVWAGPGRGKDAVGPAQRQPGIVVVVSKQFMCVAAELTVW